ncbi:MAG: tetratricopeptide repeat protein [Sphingomicrobium sp.]
MTAHWRIALPAAAVLGLAVAPASAQRPPNPEQRIAVLEQQVAASQATALRLEQRLNAIEAQLQQLINQGEVNGHRASELQSQITSLKSDVNSRLTALESRPVVQQQPDESTTSDSASASPKVEPKKSQTASAPATKGADESSDSTEVAASDPGEEAYSQGFRLWRDGKYDQAITALRAFVSGFPNHRRASFARNLIGRALLDKGEPRPAAEALLSNYRKDPKGERAPDSLYYLGQALMQLKQPGQACKAYSELEDVYGSSVRPDLKSLVAKGKADANCS